MHVLSIGSSVIDLFLKLDHDHTEIKNRQALLDLGDKIPSKIETTALGGNGANVSVGLTRLEIPTTFYTYLGKDFFSREIAEGLTSEGVELDVERHEEAPSPLHIILDFPEDRIILSNYSRGEHDFTPQKKHNYDFIFLTSIPEDWESAYKKVLSFSQEQDIPIAFSPGTRQIEEKKDIIFEVLKRTKIYFSNREEAEKITKKTNDDKELLEAVKKLGPEIVSITDGSDGARAIDETGQSYSVEPAPSDGKEKTGAGDAYATGFLASILYGNNVSEAMRWGTLNSGGVMEKIGAQNGLMTKRELDKALTSHDNLVVKKI